MLPAGHGPSGGAGAGAGAGVTDDGSDTAPQRELRGKASSRLEAVTWSRRRLRTHADGRRIDMWNDR